MRALWTMLAAVAVEGIAGCRPPCGPDEVRFGDGCAKRPDASADGADASVGNNADADTSDAAVSDVDGDQSDDAQQHSPCEEGRYRCVPEAETGRETCSQGRWIEAESCASHETCDPARGECVADAGVAPCGDGGCSCASPTECGCEPGFKPCGVDCIAESACCANEECPIGRMCAQGACKSWCETQQRPDGVAAADHQCLDFDQGLPPESVWSRDPSDGGSLSATNARAFSPPSALQVSEDGLRWSVSGAQPIAGFSLSAAVSPAQHPTISADPIEVQFVCVTIGSLEGGSWLRWCLDYMYRGSMTSRSGELIQEYTGLFIHWQIVAGAALPGDDPLYETSAPTPTPLNFKPNVWNALQVKMDSDGVHVVVNGQTATWLVTARGDTNAEVSLGASDVLVHYDNVVVSFYRQQP
jgi:hypothetical protein